MATTYIKHLVLNSTIALLMVGLVSCSSSTDSLEQEIEESNGLISLSQSQFESSNMKLGTTKEIDFPTYIQSNGTIDVPPEGKATVSTFYAGYVKNISLLPGDKVRKGQAVLTLENPEYLEIQQDYLEAKSKLAYLKSDYERQKTLNEEKIASNKNFMKSEADYKVTLITYETLGKKLQMMNINPKKVSETNLTSSITLYAPIGGFITKVDARKGTLLTPAAEAFEIINTGHIHLELRVFEKDVQKIKEGQLIKFKIPSSVDDTYEAEVHLVGKKVAGESRIVEVHGHLKNENESNSFLPGMYMEAQIEVESRKSQVLPETAVVNVGNTFYILVLTSKEGGNYKFEKRQVEIGKTANGLVEIINASKLSNTDQILVKGAFNLITE